MSAGCSIVIPVHGRAGLTRRCIEAVLGSPPRTSFELIVVDDGSPDDTSTMLATFGDRVGVVSRAENGGFAVACNDGAARAENEYLVFLNNDTVPGSGWLDALVAVAEAEPRVGVVGSKLLFPNDTVQHAGVVICQDGRARHVYAGFPAGHPAVNRPRRFQAVTAASMLVRREAFERAGGFDTGFHNSLEDVDLCLRLGELGYETRYCPESVVHHLESVSREQGSASAVANARRFDERWAGRLERDDLRHYVEDGLLRIRYRDTYPIGLEVAPELALVSGDDFGALVERQSRQVADLLRETVRLTAELAELDVREPDARPAPAKGDAVELVAEAERLQLEIHDFQARVANGRASFAVGGRLAYLDLKERMRPVVEAAIPAGETVLVVSRGDQSLLDLEGRVAWHFPQEPGGGYAGHHPADSAEAIAQIEELRARGAGYLVIPETDAWWLDHYAELAAHLRTRYEQLVSAGPCVVFRLGDPPAR